MIDLLKATAEFGYVKTIFSSKFIPSNYGKIKQFFRKILNAGIEGWIFPIIIISTCVLYPIIVSKNMTDLPSLSEKSLVMFIFISTAVSLLQVKSLLTQAFETNKYSERNLMTENENKAMSLDNKSKVWINKKRTIEQMVIEERLRSIGVINWLDDKTLFERDSWNSRDIQNTPILEFKPNINESGSCHLNILIPYLIDDQHTREFIFSWSSNILEVIAKSKTEVRQYSLSFFRKEEMNNNTHFAMIRASREDVLNGLTQHSTDEQFIRSLPGKYLSSAVAEF